MGDSWTLDTNIYTVVTTSMGDWTLDTPVDDFLSRHSHSPTPPNTATPSECPLRLERTQCVGTDPLGWLQLSTDVSNNKGQQV